MCTLVLTQIKIAARVWMMNKKKEPTSFERLNDKDTDLTMFTITNLTLTKEKNANMVFMALKLKRKIAMELLTTYLPTILLLFITFVTIFFDKDLFGDAIAVNLTIMLVMTTIFTSKIEELPPTSDMKMIDIWLIFCLMVPFIAVVISTAIEYVNCYCDICEPTDDKKEKKEELAIDQAASPSAASHQQVENTNSNCQHKSSSDRLGRPRMRNAGEACFGLLLSLQVRSIQSISNI